MEGCKGAPNTRKYSRSYGQCSSYAATTQLLMRLPLGCLPGGSLRGIGIRRYTRLNAPPSDVGGLE